LFRFIWRKQGKREEAEKSRDRSPTRGYICLELSRTDSCSHPALLLQTAKSEFLRNFTLKRDTLLKKLFSQCGEGNERWRTSDSKKKLFFLQ
jgi:hypothetical protein